MTNFSEDENFFLSKTIDELSCAGNSLSAQELSLLGKRGVEILSLSESDRCIIPRLQTKCFAALTGAYAKFTSGKNKQAAIIWRETYERTQFHASFQNVGGAKFNPNRSILGIILMEWYASIGRAQEKQALGCLPIVVFIAFGLAWRMLSIIFC